jgi:hydrogenase/urease accessory protein HupE
MKHAARLAIVLAIAFAPALASAHPGQHGDEIAWSLDHPLVIAAALAWAGMAARLLQDRLVGPGRSHGAR